MFEGGSGCAEVEGKEGSVSVTGTRSCCKASGLKWFNTGNADPIHVRFFIFSCRLDAFMFFFEVNDLNCTLVQI